MSSKILLAEDDADFGSLLKQYLELHRLEVSWVKNGEDALDLFKKERFDVGVFDVMMPKMDGFTLAEKIRKESGDLPFIFLTARKLKEDKVRGLKLGADDYIVKPFEADILVLKIQNILSRLGSVNQKRKASDIQIGKYKFDVDRHLLILGGNAQALTEKEASLIHFLYVRKNTLLKREEILSEVWGNADYFSGRSMDVFLSKIRKHFKDDPSIQILSKRGLGIEFRVENNEYKKE